MTNIVCSGDFVRDPLDDNRLREVDYIDGTTVYMTDGGFMGLDECNEVYLPSEAWSMINEQ